MKEFLKRIITSGSGVSSKRFNGTYGFAIFVILIIFVVMYDFLKDNKFEIYSLELIKVLGYLSTALLGLGIADKFKQV